jgi:hypothetical protein
VGGPPENKGPAEGYRAAVALAAQEEILIWNVFRTMVATNAFFVALAAAIHHLHPGRPLAYVGLPVLGILVCIAWMLITLRAFDFHKYFFAWARRPEETELGDTSRLVRDGRSYSDAMRSGSVMRPCGCDGEAGCFEYSGSCS